MWQTKSCALSLLSVLLLKRSWKNKQLHQSYNGLFDQTLSSRSCELSHYENAPMRYTAIFHGHKNDNFQLKNCNNFLIFAQNIDCGNTLESPH